MINTSRDESPTVSIMLPNMRGGGAERVGLNLANEFAQRGVRVRIVLMCAEGELLALLDPRVKVDCLDVSRARNLLWPLVRYLRQVRPTALLANIWPLTFLAVLARKLAGVDCRLVCVEHTTWSCSPLMKRRVNALAFKASMKWMQPRLDTLVAVSAGAADDLQRFAGLPTGSVRVLYNPVVPGASGESLFTPRALDLAWHQGGHRRLIAVGALKVEKDYPTLLRAFTRLREKVDARLLILGEGGERSALEALIRELQIEEFVELPGFLVRPAPYYAQADLFILSSTHEGFGNVVAEALGHGVPVVSTDCPNGPREILVHGKFGALIPVSDPLAMALAMQESLHSTHDKPALKARARDFAVDTIANQYLDHLLPGWRKE